MLELSSSISGTLFCLRRIPPPSRNRENRYPSSCRSLRFSIDLMSEVAAVDDLCDAVSSGSSGSEPVGSPSGTLEDLFVVSFFLEGFGAGSDPVGLDHEPLELGAAGAPAGACPGGHTKPGITHGCDPGKHGPGWHWNCWWHEPLWWLSHVSQPGCVDLRLAPRCCHPSTGLW